MTRAKRLIAEARKPMAFQFAELDRYLNDQEVGVVDHIGTLVRFGYLGNTRAATVFANPFKDKGYDTKQVKTPRGFVVEVDGLELQEGYDSFVELGEKLLRFKKQDINFLFPKELKDFIVGVRKELVPLGKALESEQFEEGNQRFARITELAAAAKKQARIQRSRTGMGGGSFMKRFSSKDLVSDVCKRAHAVNPVDIYAGFPHENNYKPGLSTIEIGLPTGLLDAVTSMDAVYNVFAYGFETKAFMSEFTTAKVEASIRHELNHWASDSIRGRFIAKRIKGAQVVQSKYGYGREGASRVQKLLSKGGTDVLLSDMEIDSQVAGVAEIRRTKTKAEWDAMSFSDLIDTYTGLLGPSRAEGKVRWRKLFKKRLAREGLLGKQMR